MATVTADDIRVLAQHTAVDPVLVLVDDRIEVLPADRVDAEMRVLYTRADLTAEYGEDVTDTEAQIAAANLTSTLGV